MQSLIIFLTQFLGFIILLGTATPKGIRALVRFGRYVKAKALHDIYTWLRKHDDMFDELKNE